MSDLLSIKAKIEKAALQYRHAAHQVRQERKALKKAQEDHKTAIHAQAIVQEVVQQIQQHAHSRIAGIVSKCLTAVFGKKAYTFNITFARRRGHTEAELYFVREGNKRDPLEESGGGCADVASMSLRICKLVLSTPPQRPLLVLDEPFKGVSPEYRHLVPEMLMSLAKEMDCQIIMATNFREYACGKIIRLR